MPQSKQLRATKIDQTALSTKVPRNLITSSGFNYRVYFKIQDNGLQMIK